MELNFNVLIDDKIETSFLEKVAQEVLLKEKKKDAIVSIALVDGETIKRINRDYRDKDEKTDVLAFAEKDVEGFSEKNYLGEIVICPAESDDLVKVLIHGILHLIGYDHEKSQEAEKEMRDKEDKYLVCFK